jgi:hypothetical protein
MIETTDDSERIREPTANPIIGREQAAEIPMTILELLKEILAELKAVRAQREDEDIQLRMTANR